MTDQSPTTVTDRPVPSVTGRSQSSTRRVLVMLGAGVVAAASVLAVLADLAFIRAYDAATLARDRAVPAALEVTAARGALVDADAAAVRQLLPEATERSRATAADDHADAMARAAQNLALVAEDSASGEGGNQAVRVVDGLLVSYRAAVEEARTPLATVDPAGGRAPAGDLLLATAHLSQGSRALHTAVFAELDELLGDQCAALDGQLGGARSPVVAWGWVLPALVLAGLLVAVQVQLRRRFRRTLNALPLAATAGLVVGAVLFGWHLVAVHGELADARVGLAQVLDDRVRDIDYDDGIGQERLALIVGHACGAPAAECGWTAPAATVGDRATQRCLRPGTEVAPLPREQTERPSWTQARAEAATRNRILVYLVPGGAASVAALVVAGLYPRLDEYRVRIP